MTQAATGLIVDWLFCYHRSNLDRSWLPGRLEGPGEMAGQAAPGARGPAGARGHRLLPNNAGAELGPARERGTCRVPHVNACMRGAQQLRSQ
jgi:hypothetical protein